MKHVTSTHVYLAKTQSHGRIQQQGNLGNIARQVPKIQREMSSVKSQTATETSTLSRFRIGLANYNLRANHCPPPCYYKLSFIGAQSYSFVYCLQLLCATTTELRSCNRVRMAWKELRRPGLLLLLLLFAVCFQQQLLKGTNLLVSCFERVFAIYCQT